MGTQTLQFFQLQQLESDLEGDCTIALVHNRFVVGISISRFPEAARIETNPAVCDLAIDSSNGLVVFGGFGDSLGTPLQLFDLRRRRTVWTMWSREGLYGDVGVAGLDSTFLPSIFRDVLGVEISPAGGFLLAWGALESSQDKAMTLAKLSYGGELLAARATHQTRAIRVSPNGELIAAVDGARLLVLDATDLSIRHARQISSAGVEGMTVTGDDGLVVTTERGEVICLDWTLTERAKAQLDALPRCVRYDRDLDCTVVGTSLGDVILFDGSAKVVDRAQLPESVRDVAVLHGGSHVIAGCKNLDLRVFATGHAQTSQAAEDWAARISRSDPPRESDERTAFISYAREDQEFAMKLQEQLKLLGISCWRDAHDLNAGRLTTQIERAIENQDVVIVILSRASLASDWVRWELANARAVEKRRGRDVLCPVCIDDAWRGWTDDPVLKQEILKYHILDFELWRDAAHFETALRRLVVGLRQNYEMRT